MTENEISKSVINACYQIHVKLGPGLFESVYEEILCFELQKEGFEVLKQQAIPLVWENMKLDHGFRADLIKHGIYRIVNNL